MTCRNTIHVLVTAHPDDESLFFLPTLYGLWQQQKRQQTRSPNQSFQIWLLCLTTGNYDGLGSTRQTELEGQCFGDGRTNTVVLPMIDKLLLVRGEDSSVANQWPLDHPQNSWKIPHVAECIRYALHQGLQKSFGQNPREKDTTIEIQFITFDEGGVSGHVNHHDTCTAVKYLFSSHKKQTQQRRRDNDDTTYHKSTAQTVSLPPIFITHVWTLETETNVVAKYLPFYCWFLLMLTWLGAVPHFSSFLSSRSRKRDDTKASWTESNQVSPDTFLDTRWWFRLQQPLRWNWRAMAAHASQFVWYRRLFVVFSCYTYVNVLRLALVHRPSDKASCLNPSWPLDEDGSLPSLQLEPKTLPFVVHRDRPLPKDSRNDNGGKSNIVRDTTSSKQKYS